MGMIYQRKVNLHWKRVIVMAFDQVGIVRKDVTSHYRDEKVALSLCPKLWPE